MSPLLLASLNFNRISDFLPVGAGTSIGFVGTAGDVYEDAWWIQDSREQLRLLGFKVTDLSLNDGETHALSQTCRELDAIFVAGGNTYFLLQQIRIARFDRILADFLERGGLYVGVSAGSIVMCPDIDITAEPDQRAAAPHLTSTAGLGFVPFAVLPHAGTDDQRFIDHHSAVLQRKQTNTPIIRITDDEAIFVDGQGMHVVWMNPSSS